MSTDFTYSRYGRRPAVAVTVGVIWVALGAAWILFNATLWILAPLALVTLPAIWDFVQNPVSGLTLSERDLVWHTGRVEGRVRLREVDFVRFDTRLDFSVRVTLVLTGDKRVRLPYECLPPHRDFEAALQARNLKVERHHFTVF